VYQRIEQKIPIWEKLLRKYGFLPEHVAMVGDDLTDLPLLLRAGLSIAVANAVDEVKRRADHVTSLPGGRGAVREAVELILRAQGRYEQELKKYLE
jgi:3-deoxy-D-manno-octulosonate 8-phosphate phosphatase (KDO 8-P phosphatase)